MIGHYIVGEAQAVAEHYHPIVRMDGSEIDFGVSGPADPAASGSIAMASRSPSSKALRRGRSIVPDAGHNRRTSRGAFSGA